MSALPIARDSVKLATLGRSSRNLPKITIPCMRDARRRSMSKTTVVPSEVIWDARLLTRDAEKVRADMDGILNNRISRVAFVRIDASSNL